MKVCVTSSGRSLDAQLDPRFGRCRYFVIVKAETLEFEAIDNTAIAVMHGAGIQAAQIVIEKGIEALITGNVGPNAYQALSTAGIRIITGVTGSIKELVERYKKGEFETVSDSTVPAKFGVGSAREMGAKQRLGRHSGRRQSMASGMHSPTYRSFPHQFAPNSKIVQKPMEELSALEEYEKKLEEELEGLKSRIKELRDSMGDST